MSNITCTSTKRLRARSISLPIASTQHLVFSKALNIKIAKQRAADWEPSINFNDLNTKPTNGDGDDNEPGLAHMVTYSAFDPGATHPLLLGSAPPIPVSSLAGHASIASQLQTRFTTSTLHHAIEIQQAAPAPIPCKFKPWPYSLPKPLQPNVGTTYDLMYGDGLGDGQLGKVKLGVLQKVLYGVPVPRKKDDEGESEGEEFGEVAR